MLDELLLKTLGKTAPDPTAVSSTLYSDNRASRYTQWGLFLTRLEAYKLGEASCRDVYREVVGLKRAHKQALELASTPEEKAVAESIAYSIKSARLVTTIAFRSK